MTKADKTKGEFDKLGLEALHKKDLERQKGLETELLRMTDEIVQTKQEVSMLFNIILERKDKELIDQIERALNYNRRNQIY